MHILETRHGDLCPACSSMAASAFATLVARSQDRSFVWEASSPRKFHSLTRFKLGSELFGRWSLRSASLMKEGNGSRETRQLKIVARLFGPSIFEASKLKVLFVGIDKDKHPEQLPRTYTLTHSDITAKLTLAVSQSINRTQLQGWYSRLQRDEVVAQWKKSQGCMSLHVHCHISGGHWLLDAIAELRFCIFRKELPVVLEAFRQGDRTLFRKHPELEEALVWVYFHSSTKEFDRVECWGPLRSAAKGGNETEKQAIHNAMDEIENSLPYWKTKGPPVRCPHACTCCFPPLNIIPLPQDFYEDGHYTQQA